MMLRCRGTVFSGFERAVTSLLLWHLVFGLLRTLPNSLQFFASVSCLSLKRILWDDGVLDMVVLILYP